MKLILFILNIFIVFYYTIGIEYSYPNNYEYSLTNGCHKGNLYFSSGLCSLNKDKNIKEYSQFFGNSNSNSPYPIDWVTISWANQKISNNSLTMCTCKLKDDNSIQFYQIGNCGDDSIEYNSTTLSFTNENHFLNIITCSNNQPQFIISATIINLTSIELNDTLPTPFIYLNGSINIFTWNYGNNVCPFGFYGNFYQLCGNRECQNRGNIGKGYNCSCKDGFKFNGTEYEVDTSFIKNHHNLDCGLSKCNITSNQLADGHVTIVFNCYCDIGSTLSFKKIANCVNNSTNDNCVCLNEKTHLFISSDGTVSCVDNVDTSKWKIPVSVMVSVIGNDITCVECGTAKCNYTNEVLNNCFCEIGFKLSSSGKSCKIDQCFGTMVEKVCGSANCNYSFFSDWSLDSNSNHEKLFMCYCDDGYILVENTNSPYCLLINASSISPNITSTTTTIVNNNSYLNWKIPIVIIVSIIILLLFGSISLYFYKKFCSKPKRVHYQLIR
ncbi:hypothetical protein ACTFIV_009877 [Dictyostelium citrinum]